MRTTLFISILLSLSACGDPDCLEYVESFNTCMDEARKSTDVQVSDNVADAKLFCDAVPESDTTAWKCQAEAFQDGDCTTAIGLSDITTARGTCANDG